MPATASDRLEVVLTELGNKVVQTHAALGLICCDHGGWAVILEELEELWEHVKQKRECRDRDAMNQEAMDVAVAAIRFILRK